MAFVEIRESLNGKQISLTHCVSDTVALRGMLKYSDPIIFQFWILAGDPQITKVNFWAFFGGFLTDISDMVDLLEMLKSSDPNYFFNFGSSPISECAFSAIFWWDQPISQCESLILFTNLHAIIAINVPASGIGSGF